MKKTFNDVLADIDKNLIGKTLHGISGTASAFTIVEVDYQNNNVVLDVQGKRLGHLKGWKRSGRKCIIDQRQMLR